MKISLETVIFEILRAIPESIHIFERHGMSCGGCMNVTTETLEYAAKKHDADAAGLMAELKALEEKRGKPQGGAKA